MKTTLNCLYYLIRRRTEWGGCAVHLHPISFLGSTLFSWHTGHLDLRRLSWQSCGLKGLKQTQTETEPWRQKVCPGRTNKFSWTKLSWPKFCLQRTYSYGSMAFFFPNDYLTATQMCQIIIWKFLEIRPNFLLLCSVIIGRHLCRSSWET